MELAGEAQAVTRVGFLHLLPLLPLAGAAVCGLAGARLARRAVHAVAIGAMLAATAVAIYAVLRLAALPPGSRFLLDSRWRLLDLAPLRVDLAFALDPLSAVMILVITAVGTLIHVYATGYMAGDPAPGRFFAYLNLFVAAMLVLVLGDSFVTLFFGWEGVGLCSYLLIGFWYRDRAKAAAGTKAFVTNRIGDWGLLAAVALLFWSLGGDLTPQGYRAEARVQAAGGAVTVGPTLVFRELRDQLALRDGQGRPVVAEALQARTLWGVPVLLLVGLGLALGVAGKSAQLPLHVWLPDAMAGPTPVSALIHAATMVTAGVYLLARLSFLVVLTPAAMTVVAAVALATAFLGALGACFERDMKRVLAYSTVSQLGLMLLAAGVGAFWAAIFHLVTHACFKACLFLAAGSVLHARHGAAAPGDLQAMGGLAAALPRTRLAYLLGCVAIAGFPIAAGFYSKDEILWRAFTQTLTGAPGALLWAGALAVACMTSYYMFRSYYLAFRGRAPSGHLRESPASMTGVLAALGAAAVISGPVLGWPEVWGGHPFLEHWLAPALAPVSFREAPRALALGLQAASVGAALLGWAAARALFHDLARSDARLQGLAARWPRAHRALQDKLGIERALVALAVDPARDLSAACAWLDRRVVDRAVHLLAAAGRGLAAVAGLLDRVLVDGAVNGVSALALAGGRRLVRVQTGRVQTYVLGIAVGVVLLVALSWVAL